MTIFDRKASKEQMNRPGEPGVCIRQKVLGVAFKRSFGFLVEAFQLSAKSDFSILGIQFAEDVEDVL